jgi:hypothetical protein
MKKRLAIAFAALLCAAPASAQHLGHIGAFVMPFDLARSVHVFTPLADGGAQEVISRDGDPAQIGLIRAHLRKEALAFARGDYSDPAAIHGAAMPGLAELRARAAQMRVDFETLPLGARLRFQTSDAALVKALHRWFEAQVREHGSDAAMNHHHAH